LINILKLNRFGILLVTFILLATSLVPFASKTQASGQFISYTYNNKSYKVYVPSGYTGSTAVPMVVMLHGCTQDPDQFATGTKMNSIAERETFIAVYPDQPSSENQNKCWRWFLSSHQSRGYGDPAHIAGITAKVKKDYSIHNDKVYVTGLSAGAAMSVIMGATYPDVFAAIGVGAGLEYKAATSESSAWNVMLNGGPDPNQQGTTAYHAMGSYKRVVPTIVFHGTSDYTVYPVNGHQVLSQWAQTNDLASDGLDNGNIDDTPEETVTGKVPDGRTFTHYTYKDSTGATVLEKYMIDGMGHAWSGGNSAGSYTDPKGPDSSEITWQFFKNHPMQSSDTNAPITVATPSGGTYEGSVTVELKANEPASTYYTTDVSSPTKNSTKYTGPLTLTGPTTLKFFSIDNAGNEEAIKTETYSITGDITAATTVANPPSGSFTSSVTVQLTTNEPATIHYTTDGTIPSTSSPVYSESLNFTTDTTLKFFSVDRSGNIENVKTENYTISQSTSIMIPSIDAEDGFVGMYLADGISSTVNKVGDKGMSNLDTYRSILSFDTSGLDDHSNIVGAKLRVYRKSLAGSVSSLSVSMIRGHWSTSSMLEQSDYNAAISSNPANGSLDFATLAVPESDNGYTEVNLPTSALEFINKGGRTQFRLKANTLADFTSDVLEIYGGESSMYSPQLIISTN
jgi:poly(hydroxyalkanoate) depolymerase family esterase